MKKSIFKNKWFWVAVGAFVLVGFIGNLFGVNKDDVDTTPPAPPSQQESTPDPEKVKAPAYEIVEEGDVNFSNVVRIAYSIVIPDKITEEQALAVGEEIVKLCTDKQEVNAIAIHIFSEKSKVGNDAYDIAMIEWAPEGDWSKADSVTTGKYGNHKYKIDVCE